MAYVAIEHCNFGVFQSINTLVYNYTSYFIIMTIVLSMLCPAIIDLSRSVIEVSFGLHFNYTFNLPEFSID